MYIAEMTYPERPRLHTPRGLPTGAAADSADPRQSDHGPVQTEQHGTSKSHSVLD